MDKKVEIFNKADMIKSMSEISGLSRKESEIALNAYLESVKTALAQEKEIRLVGFGTFKVQQRSAREGRNPKNPEQVIQIPASKTVKFSVGKDLKESVQ